MKLKLKVKEAQSLYCQEYFRDEGNGSVIRHMRLYYEFVIPAEALTVDHVATRCINEELVNSGLALNKWVIAKVESNVLQWPISSIALFKFNELTRYIDSEGFLYVEHEKRSPYSHSKSIKRILHLNYSNSQPMPLDYC